MMPTVKQLFGNIDLATIVQDTDFKEDSVREVIVLPILQALGYTQENIVRSKTLQHPFLKTGTKKRPVNLVPDYALKVENNFAWILDAKAPNRKIVNDDNVEQVYSYATHPEIRSTYFALCNGIEFSLFRTSNTAEPILYFALTEIEQHWQKLAMYLSPQSFQTGKNIAFEPIAAGKFFFHQQFEYNNRPLLEEIKVRKRAAKRHFGVHGYFTKQSWNVVAEYIKNYTKPGDLVLDPFAGSGVTAIEAMMNSRQAINIDLNPMAVFIVQALVCPVKTDELAQAFEEVKTEYLKNEPATKEEIAKALKKYKGAKDLKLPKGSDVPSVRELFTDEQYAKLALLKSIIKKQKNENIRNSLLLAFSGVVTRVNLTYHISTAVRAGTGFGGDASAMRYYRYRIAPNPTDLNVAQCFELRYKSIKKAKQDLQYFINNNTVSNLDVRKGTATDLSFLHNESVDYIYTDPPYGKKIPYLDLSIMWNAWLDLKVTEQDYGMEAIEGGERHKTKDDYNTLIAQSIREMYRVLKFDRWLSFVFAHKDPEFWHLIIETAENCGFEYAGAVAQKNGQTSFKKRQNPFTVLSGQLIINFRKVRNPRAIMKANIGMNMTQTVMQTIEGIIAKYNGATLEQINDELIIKGLEMGFLDLLKKEYSDLTPLLKENFDYNNDSERYTIRKNAKFTALIDLNLRIKYYLTSFLRRKERENKTATFDELILEIIPLLKNGATPEDQTVLNVLESIAERVGEDRWRLKRDKQRELFDSDF